VGFTSGPKITHFDRVEWVTLDTFSAMAALGRGEIDWWEGPSRDVVDQLARDRNVTAVSHYATAIGIVRFKQLYPPFDNPAIRRALLGAIDQAEAMTAVAGTDPANWRDVIGLFGTGTTFCQRRGNRGAAQPAGLSGGKAGLGAGGLQRRADRRHCPDGCSRRRVSNWRRAAAPSRSQHRLPELG
jgi:peptide/nickel transport system substrate-binding protein